MVKLVRVALKGWEKWVDDSTIVSLQQTSIELPNETERCVIPVQIQFSASYGDRDWSVFVDVGTHLLFISRRATTRQARVVLDWSHNLHVSTKAETLVKIEVQIQINKIELI